MDYRRKDIATLCLAGNERSEKDCDYYIKKSYKAQCAFRMPGGRCDYCSIYESNIKLFERGRNEKTNKKVFNL